MQQDHQYKYTLTEDKSEVSCGRMDNVIYIYIKVPRGCVGHDDNDFAKVRLTGAQFEEYKPLLGRGFMLHGDDETCGIGYDSPHAWELLQTNLAKHSRVFTDNDFANVNYE